MIMHVLTNYKTGHYKSLQVIPGKQLSMEFRNKCMYSKIIFMHITNLSSARNKDQKLVGCFFKNRIFYRLLHCCPIENVWEIWPIMIDFGRPNAEIGRKMANGRLLFLTLLA